MRKIYLVRHGETTGNVNNIHQDEHTQLSEWGKKQASFVASRLKDIPFEVILSSPFKRARQTAEIINTELKIDIEFNELLREYSRPTEIQNKPFYHPLSKKVRKELSENFHDPSWHYSDEENFADFRLRVAQAKAFMERRTEDHILMVSHGLFIKMFVGLLVFPKSMNSHMFLEWIDNSWHTNTGVTVVEYNDRRQWRLLTWSDYSHLPS